MGQMDDLPLFERRADGALVRVPPKEAAARRAGRTVTMEISREHGRRLILLTAEEEAARAKAAAEGARVAAAEKTALLERQRARESAEAKLAALGLTPDEIAALKG